MLLAGAVLVLLSSADSATCGVIHCRGGADYEPMKLRSEPEDEMYAPAMMLG